MSVSISITIPTSIRYRGKDLLSIIRRQADFQILTFGPTAIRAHHRTTSTNAPRRVNTRAATSSRLVKKKEEGYSHSKCVFTSDRVMTNNGALRSRIQRSVMYEKSDPGWLMTMATRLSFLGRKGGEEQVVAVEA